MIQLMREPVERDALDIEIEDVLRENRIALVRSEGLGERMLAAWHRYSIGMDNLLRRLGVELPPPSGRPRPRRRCPDCPRGR